MTVATTRKRLRLRVITPVFPIFNIYSRIARRTTALGPVCIATSARQVPGWDAEVVDENNLRRYGPELAEGGADHQFLQQERPADVVALYGGLTSSVPRLYEIARFYKEQGVTTLAGGQHFAAPENIEEALYSHIDYVVVGEGEYTIQELLAMLTGSRDKCEIKGIAYLENSKLVQTPAREPVRDFAAMPLPDFSLVRYAKISLYPVERIRGCGMDCEFCTVKGKPRPASAERLFETITMLVETRSAECFFVVDDLFGQQREETIRFCKMMAEYQKQIGKALKLSVQIRWDKADDSELLQHMRLAGINNVAIGFESPIKEELSAMRKHVKPEEMLNNTKEFSKFGFWVHGMFIFGYPMNQEGEFFMSIKERIKRYRQFIKKAHLDTIQVLLPVPLPGTELRERLQKEGRIYPVEQIGWQYYDGNFPLFEPDTPLASEEMQTAARYIMRKFYGFKYLLLIAWKICSFPSIIFFSYNLKLGWHRWYRTWRNYLVRFGGWLTIKNWLSKYKKDPFEQRLAKAKEELPGQSEKKDVQQPPKEETGS